MTHGHHDPDPTVRISGPSDAARPPASAYPATGGPAHPATGGPAHPGRHEQPSQPKPTPQPSRPEPPVSFGAELRDAVAPRAVILVVGVLLLQLGFILSYVGAFHAPTPQHVPVTLVAPAQVSSQVLPQVNGLSGRPLDLTAATDKDAALALVTSARASAALVYNTAGSQDTLYVASGGGVSVVTAVEQVVTQVETAQKRTVTVVDLVPLQPGDGRGLTGFYLVIGWIVGGYLVAALLGVARGARPANTRRAIIRLLAVVPYALASGAGGVLIVDQALGAITGHFVELWLLGALLVFGAAAVTMAFQVLLGVLGIGLTVLIFVVLGNPSAGGAYQPSLLPPFWRALAPALPNGAGTDAVRRIVYFGGYGNTGHLIVIAIYAAAGAVVALAGSMLLRKREGTRGDKEAGVLV